MKDGRELNSLIIGIGKIVFMIGQFIFLVGFMSYWLGTETLFSIYLMLGGIGIVFILGQKVENIHLVKIIRKYRGRKRKTLPKQKE